MRVDEDVGWNFSWKMPRASLIQTKIIDFAGACHLSFYISFLAFSPWEIWLLPACILYFGSLEKWDLVRCLFCIWHLQLLDKCHVYFHSSHWKLTYEMSLHIALMFTIWQSINSSTPLLQKRIIVHKKKKTLWLFLHQQFCSEGKSVLQGDQNSEQLIPKCQWMEVMV